MFCQSCGFEYTQKTNYCKRCGGELNAAFRLGNVFATQFHPEKSGTAGLQLLANFVDLCVAA